MDDLETPKSQEEVIPQKPDVDLSGLPTALQQSGVAERILDESFGKGEEAVKSGVKAAVTEFRKNHPVKN